MVDAGTSFCIAFLVKIVKVNDQQHGYKEQHCTASLHSQILCLFGIYLRFLT